MAAPTYTTAITLQSFNWVAVTTGADTVVTCGLEDIAVQHSNLQANDIASPTASASTDYIVVTDAQDSTNPTDDLDPGTAAGSKSHKLIIRAGGSAVFRGSDMGVAPTATNAERKFNIRAVGNTAFVQLSRGTVWGTLP